MSVALHAIVFDFDGVIADSERLHLLAYQDVLAPLGLTLTDEAYSADYLGYDDLGVFRAYSARHDLEWNEAAIAALVAAKAARFEQLAGRGGMLFPGAAAFIRAAAGRVPLAIASGALTREIEDILAETGLRQHFRVVVGADRSLRSKPSPDPYLEAFHRLAAACRSAEGGTLERARTVAIEDSRWGLLAAAAAGLRPVAVSTTYPARELAPHAELVVAGLHALTLGDLEAICASSPAAWRPAFAPPPS
jgi:beta-phosphoglucomutase-like phosphatase (HAD superfamily)